MIIVADAVAVIFSKAVACSDPDVSGAVLCEAVDLLMRQPVGGGEMAELYLFRTLCGNTGRQVKQN